MRLSSMALKLRLALLGFAAALTGVVLVLVGCGGGVGSGGTGGFASGPITGFGSVIVNDVRFDDSSAQVLDGDGNAHTRDDLRLGMTVEIDSSAISSDANGASASASRIRYDSDLLGTVDSVDAAGASFSVLGQRVVVDSTTVFDQGVGGLAQLLAGQLVEVYAVYDSAAVSYRATRVALAASGATSHLRGLVAQSDATTKTLRIGNASYGYGTASGVPSDVGAGQYVRLLLSAQPPTAGRYSVQSFGTALTAAPESSNGSVEGLITSLVSKSSFSVNGRPVDASAATFPNGSTGLAVGVRVSVEGVVRDGTVRATRVSIDSDAQHAAQLFELHGAITAVNPAQQSFVLRGLTVSTGRTDLVYQNGGAAQVVAGRQVTVKGRLSADGLRIEATSISFE